MKTDQPRIKVRRAALIFVAGIITASCSEKSAPDRKEDVNTSEASPGVVREPGSEKAEREGKVIPANNNFRYDVDATGRIDGNDVSATHAHTRTSLP